MALIVAVCALSWSPAFTAGQAHAQSAGLRPGDHTFSLSHDGRSRSFIVHVPQSAATDRALPVVLAFHGGGGEAEGFKRYAGLDVVADREGFLVVYPNGTGPLPRRLLTWNAGECCGYAMNQKVDDVGFAVAILDDLARRTAVDARRTYATGHSNGAMMSYRLGAERADRIAAIAPVAGSYSLERFAPSRPVAVMHIHSVDDPRAMYNGGVGPPFPGTNVRSSHRPVEEGLERWRRHNGCSTQTRVVDSRTGTAPSGGAKQTATLLAWDGCTPGGQTAHWKLTGVGHGWPGNSRGELREELIGPATTLVVAAEEIWKFFATASGLAAQGPEPSRRVLIVVDELSIQFQSTPRVHDLLLRLLRVLEGNGDVVRMVLTGDPRTTVPFSTDSTVSKAVGKGLLPLAVARAQPTSADAVELRLRSDLMSSTVASALRSMSAAGSGPITIVYFTEGYPAFVPEPTEFLQEASRVNATVYVIDPRGRDAPDPGREGVQPFDAKDWEAYVAATRQSVRTLADKTTGVAVFTRGEFDAVLSSLATIAPLTQ